MIRPPHPRQLTRRPLATDSRTAWFSSSRWRCTASLDLAGQYLGPDRALELATSSMACLFLSSNLVGGEGARALASVSLTHLNLTSNRITNTGAQALATFGTIDSLGLGQNQIGDAGAAALARNRHLTALASPWTRIASRTTAHGLWRKAAR